MQVSLLASAQNVILIALIAIIQLKLIVMLALMATIFKELHVLLVILHVRFVQLKELNPVSAALLETFWMELFVFQVKPVLVINLEMITLMFRILYAHPVLMGA